MSTKTGPKPLKKAEQELMVRWLKFYDFWLWSMRVSSRDAEKFAKEDGLPFVTSRRLAICANKPDVCERWKVEKSGNSVKQLLNSDQWNALLTFVESHKAELQDLGSATAAASLAYRSGLSFHPNAMVEALKSRGMSLPLRTERPKFEGAEKKEAA